MGSLKLSSKIMRQLFILLVFCVAFINGLQCNEPGICYGDHWSYGKPESLEECLDFCKNEDRCKWISFSESTGNCYGFSYCSGIQNYYDFLSVKKIVNILDRYI